MDTKELAEAMIDGSLGYEPENDAFEVARGYLMLSDRCDRDDKLIFQMKDEISKLKSTVNDLRQANK